MEAILERLRTVPVCALDGCLRRVQRIQRPGPAASGRINGAAGNLTLTAAAGVLFRDGETLTGAELLSARETAPGCWELQGRDGRARTLQLFNLSPGAACTITVTQGGRSWQLQRPVYRLLVPEVLAAPHTAGNTAIPE